MLLFNMREKDVVRHTHNRLGATLRLGLLGGAYSCLLDFDHVWAFIFQVPDPISFTGIPGRPLHHIGVFMVYSIFLAAVMVALILRRNDLE